MTAAQFRAAYTATMLDGGTTMQAYGDPNRESDPHALPDVEIFELTAREVAETMEDEIYVFMKRREFRLAKFNSRYREAMFDAMIEEFDVEGGWFYWSCFPGCLPDGPAIGPFESREAALAASQLEE